MISISTNIDFNLNVELNLEDSQFQKLFNVYGPELDSELNERLKHYIQSSVVDMIGKIKVDDEFIIAMQLEPNSRNLTHATIGNDYLYQ